MTRARSILLAGLVFALLASRAFSAEEPAALAGGKAATKVEQPAKAKQPKAAQAKKEAKKEEFLRLVQDAKQTPVALESAIVTCVPQDRGKTRPTVDLVAAVHIADKGYYEQINRLFVTYDVVLYELVAPKGTRIPKGGAKSDHPLSAVQVALTRVLNLAFQLDQVDYTRPNLVHADMSPAQFAQSMEQHGDNFWKVLLRLVAYAMAQEDSDSMSEARVVAALFSKDRALALKRIMAEQFRDMEGSITTLEGVAGETLIADRNKVALEELRKQIAAGKKKIAIFYGAAHMPNFQKRLKDEFGLVPVSTRWLVAWDMKAAPAPAAGPKK